MIVASFYAKDLKKRKEKALAKKRHADFLQAHERDKCGRKLIYRSEEHARKIGKQQQERSLMTRLWVYACQKCGKWHLTHRPQKPEQAVDYLKEAA